MAGDDRLADLAAAGDEHAFTVIFERHHQALYRYCRSILGNNEDASDALQNTMLRALRALPGEKRTIALKPWLFRIAHNEAISLVRRRRPQVDVEDEALGLQSAGPAVDSDLRERVDRLFEDLKELPDRQRGALIMRELSGLSYDDIAAALHTSTGAATQVVFEARKALHEFAEGRDMRCDGIRHEISRRDGRVLASRRIRAHLRQCKECSAFKAMIYDREREFAALAPPMPAIVAAAMLHGLQGGGGVSGGLSALAAAGSSHAALSTAAVKAAGVLAAAAAGAGAGAVVTPGVSRIADPPARAGAIRAFATDAGDKAHTAAVDAVQRTSLRRTPAVAPARRTAGAGRSGQPPTPAAVPNGTDESGGGPPAATVPVAPAPEPDTTPRRPAPERKATPAPPAPARAPTTNTQPGPPGDDGEPDDNSDDVGPCPPQPAECN
jgi:RNA polymerase sigma factor (sigma-70 family)